MQISLLLALQILKLFAIMLMGYAIVKLGLRPHDTALDLHHAVHGFLI